MWIYDGNVNLCHSTIHGDKYLLVVGDTVSRPSGEFIARPTMGNQSRAPQVSARIDLWCTYCIKLRRLFIAPLRKVIYSVQLIYFSYIASLTDAGCWVHGLDSWVVNTQV